MRLAPRILTMSRLPFAAILFCLAAIVALALPCPPAAAQQADPPPVAPATSATKAAPAPATTTVTPVEAVPADAGSDASAEDVSANGDAVADANADSGDGADGDDGQPAFACTVADVKRTVEWRPTESDPWAPVKEGLTLPVGSDIRTGFRAVCSLVFKDAASAIQLEPLTIIRIGEFTKADDGRVRTRLYLKQGATRSVVEKSRIESDFAIITPEITLAVQGTRVIHTTHQSDRGTRVRLSNSGLISVTNRQTGRGRQLRPGDSATGLMLLAIENAQFGAAVPIFDQYGGVTQNEQYSILRGPQVYAGVGTQQAPGSTQFSGAGSTPFDMELFWQQYMQYMEMYEEWMSWLEDNYPEYVPPSGPSVYE